MPIARAGVPAAIAVAIVAGVAGLESQTSTSRLVVIASDLHLGVGRSAGGEWLPIEDFRWQEDFASFLRAIDEAGKGATDLVLNGDTFELWQSTTDDCRQRDVRLGCTEQEALGRLERVIAAHTRRSLCTGDIRTERHEPADSRPWRPRRGAAVPCSRGEGHRSVQRARACGGRLSRLLALRGRRGVRRTRPSDARRPVCVHHVAGAVRSQ